MTNHLIVSSDIRSWKSDNKKIFLGKWCFKNHDKKFYSYKENIVNSLFKDDREYIKYKDKIWNEVDKYRDEIFNDLCTLLNNYHKTKYDERFYKILLGQWFDWCLQFIFERQALTKLVIKNCKVGSFTFIDSSNITLSSNNLLEFLFSNLDDYWNQKIFYKLLLDTKNKNIKIKKIIDNNILKIDYRSQYINTTKIKSSINYLKNLYMSFQRNFLSDNDAYITSTYLSKINEIKLNLAINKKPLFFIESFYTHETKENIKLRKNLYKKISKSKPKLNIIKSLLIDLMPITYLEAFKDLIKYSNKLKFPRKPKFILTATQTYNESFALWVANQVFNGTPLFTIQHGGYYGWQKQKFLQMEEIFSDKFITWGWKKRKNDVRGFNVRMPKKNILKRSVHGFFLLMLPPSEVTTYRFFYSNRLWSFTNYDKYRNEIKKFVLNLDSKIVQNTLVRLYLFNELSSCETPSDYDFWKGVNFVKIERGSTRIKKLINKSRLVIHTYISTGFLDTLNQNIPTIMIVTKMDLKSLDEKVKTKHFNKLISNNIIFTNFNAASKFLNKIGDDIDQWWFEKKTQKAIKDFCYEYSAQSDNPIKELKRILN